MKGNWVCTFGLGTSLQHIAMLFENCEELEVREKMANQFNGVWAGIYSEQVFNNSKYRSKYSLIKGEL